MYAMPPAVPFSTAFTPAKPAAVPHVVEQTVAPAIVQQVSIQQTPARSDLLVGTEQWSWAELRDYVVAQIIERFGPFPRNARKEYGIFSRFFNEYGQDAIRVAQFAFGPTCEGWWGNAPISVNRFCRDSDPYFATPILERLNDAVS